MACTEGTRIQTTQRRSRAAASKGTHEPTRSKKSEGKVCNNFWKWNITIKMHIMERMGKHYSINVVQQR